MEENKESQPLLTTDNTKKKNKYGDTKDIISLMSAHGFFSLMEIATGTGIGAGIAAFSHVSQDSVTTENGALLGMLSTVIPFGTAWLALPLTVRTWVACQAFRKQSERPQSVDCNHFLLSKMFWFSTTFTLPTLLVPLISSLLAGSVGDIPVEKGLAIGMAFFFSNFLVGPALAFPTSMILTGVNKLLHRGEEETRSFCIN